MNGRFASDRFPYIPMRLSIRGHVLDLEALIDTGFEGALIIPADALQLEGVPDTTTRWILADGSSVGAPVYGAIVELGSLGSLMISVSVLGSEFLVGRKVTDQFTIILDHGQRVIIEP